MWWLLLSPTLEWIALILWLTILQLITNGYISP